MTVPLKRCTLLVIQPSPTLRRVMEELRRRYGYELRYAADAYEAVEFLENTAVDAAVCEAVPAYSAECRLLREISSRSSHLPLIVFVGPEGENYLFDDLAQATFRVVRPATPLDSFHRLLQDSIAKMHRAKAA